nr:histidine kinase [uncultured Duganella sp.]
MSKLPTRLWIAAVWFGLALFDATQNVFLMKTAGMHHAWVALFFFRFLYWLVWALATPAVLRQGMRYAAGRRAGWQTWCAHLLACLAIGMIGAVWTATLEYTMDPWMVMTNPPWTALWYQHFVGGVLTDMVIYATAFAIGYGLHARERLMLEQAARVQAQLDGLRRQIEPHFLFNTLNTVTGLVREERNEAAVATIASLSDLLRRVLDDSGRNLISLGEELDFLDKYLAIQKMRFGERLQYSVQAPAALMSASLPSLLLQPLVENGFKHGLAHRAQGGVIRLAISAVDGMLDIAIYNDGPPLQPDAPPGIGWANVRERLRGLYGPHHRLEMHNRDSGVEVRIALPLRGVSA